MKAGAHAVDGRPAGVLVVAFHFPPFGGSSGVQRTLRFVQQLPRHGWQPIVLTVRPEAHEDVRPDLVGEVPADVVVERAFAFDAARQLAWRGRYPGFLARPDRWISWWPDAVRRGRQLIARYRPRAIFSTYPIATAHVVGATLAAGSGLPWIADFRDPMAQDGYPDDPKTWQRFKQIEERVFARAAACTFTTRSAAAAYRTRYPATRARIQVIENGYDEASFAAAERDGAGTRRGPSAVPTLLHSGVVYPDERDPRALVAALAQLKAEGLGASRLRVRFRAAVHDSLLRDLAQQAGVGDMVELAPAVPYRDALREMLAADGLLVLQAANCNAQIPAKLYEYARAGRPIVALTDPVGDTAHALAALGVHDVAPLDSADAIATLLRRFVAVPEVLQPDATAARLASREHRAEQLADLLSAVAGTDMTEARDPVAASR